MPAASPRTVKLPSQFAALAPKVRDFFENKAFGRWVDLNDMVTVPAMSTQVASYVCIQEFSRVLKQLSIADQVPQLLAPDRLLSTCQPFPWSRKVYEANHSVSILVPCDNDFEKAFARFLENADDVNSFREASAVVWLLYRLLGRGYESAVLLSGLCRAGFSKPALADRNQGDGVRRGFAEGCGCY